jgi:hypothetical protein
MTPEQLRRLQQAITDRYEYIAAQMDEGYQPDPAQLMRWQRLGLVPKEITTETFALSVPPEMHMLRNAFVLGRMAEAVEQGESFDQVMHLALQMPLKKPDLAAIAMAEQHAGIYIRNFAGDVSTEAGKLWAREQGERVRQMAIDFHGQTLQAKVLDVERKIDAGIPIPEKQVTTWQQFGSELHHTMEDKARDWQRVAYTELTDTGKRGEALRILELHGPDVLVYKKPMPTACAQCRHAYLLADDKTPRLFRLRDLLDNASNVGRKAHPTRKGKVLAGGREDGQEAVKAVAGVMHPWCQCGGPYVATGYEPWLTEKQKELVKQSRAQRIPPRPPQEA